MEKKTQTPKNQEVIPTQESQEQTQEAAPIPNPTPQEQKQDKEEKLADKATYDKYTSLKFLQLSGAKLKDDTLKELKELEAELKQCSGKISKKTVRAAIQNEQVLLVEGMPIPAEYVDIIEKCSKPEYYF